MGRHRLGSRCDPGRAQEHPRSSRTGFPKEEGSTRVPDPSGARGDPPRTSAEAPGGSSSRGRLGVGLPVGNRRSTDAERSVEGVASVLEGVEDRGPLHRPRPSPHLQRPHPPRRRGWGRDQEPHGARNGTDAEPLLDRRDRGEARKLVAVSSVHRLVPLRSGDGSGDANGAQKKAGEG